jgi:transcriptional regulator with XRE-family HTH domain
VLARPQALRLRRLRETLGLSQREMAAELGVAHGAVGQWETGARSIPGPVLRLMALYEEELGDPPLDGIPASWLSRSLRLSSTATSAAVLAIAAALGRALADERQASALTRRTQEAVSRRIVAALGEMKGLAMKVGQMAAYLDFTAPEETRLVLERLQAESRAIAPSVVAEIVLAELGGTPREVFAEWAPRPFAAASIGQVHRARLRSGEEVAVKVQYPRIVEALEADLRNVMLVDRASALLYQGREPGAFAAEMRERFLEECDYLQEAAHQEQFRRLWAGRPGVRVPRVFEALTTRRVLVSEFVAGHDLRTFVATATAEEKDRAGERLFELAFESIWRHGLFNADPHPGNYLFDRGDVVFLDFGCVKRFTAQHLATWKRLLRAMLERDFDGAAQRWVEVGVVRDPARFDFPYHHRLTLLLHRPWLSEGEFRFTTEYVERTWRVAWIQNRNRFRVNIPKDWVFLTRLEWGLYAVLGKLEAQGRWRDKMLDLLYEPGEPRPRPYTPDELALLLADL